MGTTDRDSTRAKRPVSNVVIALVSFSTLLVSLVWLRRVTYLSGVDCIAGLGIGYSWTLLAIVHFAWMALLAFCVVATAICLIRLNVLNRFQATHLPLIAVLVGCITMFFFYPRPATFLVGVRDAAVEKLDVEAIRLWRTAVPHPAGSLIDDDLPGSIAKMNPSWVELLPDDATRIIWGSGFGHWGVDVLPAEPRFNASTPVRDALSAEKGIRVWFDAGDSLWELQ